jgi:hypothetical protein
MSEIGLDSGFIPVAIGLLVFGTIYNLVVAWMERNGYDEGYTAIMVVVGVLVTLGGLAMVDWRAAALTVVAFACSGTPMVLGSWWRHAQARKRAQDELRGMAR